jgi:two-component system nitrogen regulation response regulator GlnG
MTRILVVDDEPAIGWSLREFLTDMEHDVQLASSGGAGWELWTSFSPEIVILDVRLPDADGLTLLERFRENNPAVPVIVMTAFGDLATAVRAVELGAFDYMTKPFDLDHAAAVVARAADCRSPLSAVAANMARDDDAQLLGTSAPMQQVYKQIALAVTSDSPVLVVGETGTGKELVASAIHRHGRRKKGPFVPVCLAALNPSVLESELFGHARGAFTGAADERAGLIEQAEGGTLFLDEIGDTPMTVQVKLLRFLESRQYSRVGSNQVVASDVRIVAATHRRLNELIRSGEFREDLFFRLRGIEIEVPPLRDRLSDIGLLATAFWNRIAPERIDHKLSAEFLDALKSRRWRGNVRELRAAITQAALSARGGPLLPQYLPQESDSQPSTASVATLQAAIEAWVRERLSGATATGTDGTLYRDFLSAIEPALLKSVLAACDSNRAAAARCLGLDRTTLRTRLRSYDLDGSDGES